MTDSTTTAPTTWRRSPLLWPAALFVLALALRLAALGAKSLWFDEALSLDDSTSVRTRFGSGFHPPVYYVLLHGWTALFGASDLSLRLTAVLPGALTVPALYLLGKRLFGRREGLAGALLLCTASLHVEFSQEVRMYALATFLVTVAALLVAECVEREPGADARTRYGLAAAVTAAFALAAGTHYLTLPVLIGLGVALLAEPRRGAPVLGRLALVVAPVLAAGLLVVRIIGYGKQLRAAALFASNLGGVNQTIFANPLGQLVRLPVDLLIQILPGFSVKWLVLSHIRWPAVALVDAAIVAGATTLALRRSAPRIARALVLAPAAVAVLVAAFMVGAGQLRFYVVASPFVLLAAGAGLVSLRRWNLGPILLATTIALSLYATATYLTFPMDKQPWRAVGARLARETRPGDVVLVTEPHLRIAFDRYFTPPPGVDVSAFPEESGVRITEERLTFFLVPLVRDARRVWFVQMSDTASHSDPDGIAKRWLAQNFDPVARLRERGYNGDVEITLYER
jgi:uncharacterized membrane protein